MVEMILSASAIGISYSNSGRTIPIRGPLMATVAMSPEPQHDWRLAEKYLMSLVIDMSARTVKPEGHPSVPLKESVDDEDVVAFASPRASDDVVDGRLNRITGEALIHFLTDPMYEFHGRCYRAESLFEKALAR